MDLREINDLIAIKQYAVIMMNSMTVERSMLKFLSSIVPTLDGKIVELLSGSEFQNYLNGVTQSPQSSTAEAPTTPVVKNGLVRRSKPIPTDK